MREVDEGPAFPSPARLHRSRPPRTTPAKPARARDEELCSYPAIGIFPLKPTHAPVKACYAALAQFHLHGHTTKGNTPSAFADLLKRCACPYGWHLVEEYQFQGTAKQSLRADGALVDELTLVHGLWEAKDADDELKAEIKKKVAAGYPLTKSSSHPQATPPHCTTAKPTTAWDSAKMDSVPPEDSVANSMTSAARSRNMAAIRSKNTRPELFVRRMVHKMGYRYRLHSEKLPGKPDIVFASRQKIILIHGCFWHRHSNCKNTPTPKTRTEYWQQKFATNVDRDRRTIGKLHKMGWGVMTVWECEIARPEKLARRIDHFLASPTIG